MPVTRMIASVILRCNVARSVLLSVVLCSISGVAVWDDGPQQTGPTICGPVLTVRFAPIVSAIIGHSGLQHCMECIPWWQEATAASAGIAVRTMSNPATNLANRLMLMALGLPELASAACDLNHSQT